MKPMRRAADSDDVDKLTPILGSEVSSVGPPSHRQIRDALTFVLRYGRMEVGVLKTLLAHLIE